MAATSTWGMSPAAPLTHRTSSRRSSADSCHPPSTTTTISGRANPLRWPSSSQHAKPRYRSTRGSSNLSCRCSFTSGEDASCSTNIRTTGVGGGEWDWDRWTRHFSEIEQAESQASLLQFQLEDAIEREDFTEAAKLKFAISEATSKDTIAEIMYELKKAIDEERYRDASKLSKSTGSGLVGWWVGYSKDSDNPYGKMVQITPGVGRFIAKSYSPRQLVTKSPGTPLFEIYVVRDSSNGNYSLQVVFLSRTKGNSGSTAFLQPKPVREVSSSESENSEAVEIQGSEDNKSEKQEEEDLTIEEATEEGIKSVINFLKDRIPELKVKIMNVNVPEEILDSDSLNQLIQEEEEDEDFEETDETSDDESVDLDELETNNMSSTTENVNTKKDENGSRVKLFVGGVVHNIDDASSKTEIIRVPAEINDMEKDSFLLHVPGVSGNGENKLSNVKVAAVLRQGVSNLMPADVAKTFLGSDTVSSKVSQDVHDIVKLAITQAQKMNKLSEYTTFNRLATSKGHLDPFEGIYVGAFGPHGTEVVQLRRKFGHWNTESDMEKSSDVEFFEYVEAVKLTGDLNVPAGEVTFRAKIGRGSRLSNRGRGLYPDELGVVASYKGQGRVAGMGFKNPKWVEGELLQLNGKGIGPYVRGSDLGFLYIVPEQSFLILFNRINLPE